MQSTEFKKHWRYRITSMIIYFLNERKEIITEGRPPDNDYGFGMTITLPLTYHDISWNKELQMFVRGYGVNPDCITSRKGNNMTECKLTGLRSISPNGTFIFEVRNRIDLDMDNFHSLKLTLGVEYYDYK